MLAGDDGFDGKAYVNGTPWNWIDGQYKMLAFGGAALGWGLYDIYHHWHGAPAAYSDHTNRFHSGGMSGGGHAESQHAMATSHGGSAMHATPMPTHPGVVTHENMSRGAPTMAGRGMPGGGRVAMASHAAAPRAVAPLMGGGGDGGRHR